MNHIRVDNFVPSKITVWKHTCEHCGMEFEISDANVFKTKLTNYDNSVKLTFLCPYCKTYCHRDVYIGIDMGS